MSPLAESPLGLQLAELRVEEFVEETTQCEKPKPWNVQYNHDIDCENCEEWLKKGINAFAKLQASEADIREGSLLGLIEFTPDLQRRIDSAYVAWLNNCPRTEAWIERLRGIDQRPSNLDEFIRICEEVRSIVEDREWSRLSLKTMTEEIAAE